MGINKLVLVGRMANDPVSRQSRNGKRIAMFTLAVDRNYVSKNVDNPQTVDFIRCVVFTNQADAVIQYTKRGSLVGVTGSVEQRKYTNKDGVQIDTLEVNCDSVQFLDSKSDQQANQPRRQSVSQYSNQPNNQSQSFHQYSNRSSDGMQVYEEMPGDDIQF